MLIRLSLDEWTILFISIFENGYEYLAYLVMHLTRIETVKNILFFEMHLNKNTMIFC